MTTLTLILTLQDPHDTDTRDEKHQGSSRVRQEDCIVLYCIFVYFQTWVTRRIHLFTMYDTLMLFIIVMDAVSEHIGREVPWDMLYAEDLALAEQTETGMQNRFGD